MERPHERFSLPERQGGVAMSPFRSLKQYLEENGVKYEHLVHSEAYTSQEKAALSHTPGKQRAKSVIIWGNGKLYMVVIPAHKKIDLEKTKKCLGYRTVRLAKEDEFANIFSGCELGALHVFGNLYDIPVLVDALLGEQEEIFFTACTHHDTVKITFADFERLVNPTKCDVVLDID